MSITSSRANTQATRNALRARPVLKTEIARGTEERDRLVAAFKAEGYRVSARKFDNGTPYPCYTINVFEA